MAMTINPLLQMLKQPIPEAIQQMIDKPGEPIDDDDRRAPARRALLQYLWRSGVQTVDFEYRCDPIVIDGDTESHISVQLKGLRTQSGQTIPSELVADTPIRSALEKIGFVDVAFATRFGRVVDNARHGLYQDEMDDDEVITSPRAGAARVITARGDIVNTPVDADGAQAIFDAMPDPEQAGSLSDGAEMRRRTTTSHRWR